MKKEKNTGRIEESEFWLQVDKDGNPIGDVKEVDVVIKPTERQGFFITYLTAIVNMIDVIGNKKMQVIKFILQEMDKPTNKLNMTTNEISKATGISRMTVTETLKILENAGIIARKTGLVMLSPKLIHKGSSQHERFLLTKFHEVRMKQKFKDLPTDEVKGNPEKYP